MIDERTTRAQPDVDRSIDRGVDGTTELRVHGVSGTPPSTILEFPLPLLKCVDGDQQAGFYRRWYPGGTSADLSARRRLEAYSWGGLTSGSAKRAFWLLLLPFMLANVAHWMLPAVPPQPSPWQRRAARLAVALLRLFGLALTLTMLLTAVQVAVDVAGWQCGRIPSCAQSSGVLGPLVEGFLGSPGRRVAVTAVIPLVVVLIVGLLGRRTVRKTPSAAVQATTDAGQVPLADRRFWEGNPGLPRLRTAHVGAATGLLAAQVAWPATSLVATGVGRAIGLVLCIAGLAAFAASVVLVAAEDVTGREAGMRAPSRPGPLAALLSERGAKLVQRSALVVLVLGTVYSAWGWDGPWQVPGRLPGLRPAILSLFVLEVLLLLVLALAVGAQRPWRQGVDASLPQDGGGYRVAMRGFGAPVVSAAAFLVAGGFSAGLTYRVAELLGHPVLSQVTASEELVRNQLVAASPEVPFQVRLAAATAETPLVVPPSFAWAGAAATVILAAVLVILAFLALSVWRRLPGLVKQVLAEYDAVEGDPMARDDAAGVARAQALASLTDRAGRVIGRITIVAGAVLLAGIGVYASGADNWQLVEEPPLTTLTRIGTWVMGLFAAALVALFWNAYRNPAMRRTVGILWDVGSFWPRVAHPMAPPSYAERAIPDLADRVRTLTATPDSRVLLSGHSQGSVLVASTVLLVPPDRGRQSALLTHGSPLRRLYTRFFPAYFGLDTLKEIDRRLSGSWRNLYRDTDPVGAWVLDPGPANRAPVDRHLRDPRRLGEEIEGHSNYWRDPDYASAVTELESRPSS